MKYNLENYVFKYGNYLDRDWTEDMVSDTKDGSIVPLLFNNEIIGRVTLVKYNDGVYGYSEFYDNINLDINLKSLAAYIIIPKHKIIWVDLCEENVFDNYIKDLYNEAKK